MSDTKISNGQPHDGLGDLAARFARIKALSDRGLTISPTSKQGRHLATQMQREVDAAHAQIWQTAKSGKA